MPGPRIVSFLPSATEMLPDYGSWQPFVSDHSVLNRMAKVNEGGHDVRGVN